MSINTYESVDILLCINRHSIVYQSGVNRDFDRVSILSQSRVDRDLVLIKGRSRVLIITRLRMPLVHMCHISMEPQIRTVFIKHFLHCIPPVSFQNFRAPFFLFIPECPNQLPTKCDLAKHLVSLVDVLHGRGFCMVQDKQARCGRNNASRGRN